MSCEKITPYLEDFVSGRCDRAEWVAKHLGKCESCLARVEQLSQAALSFAELGDAAPVGFRERVMRTLESQPKPGLLVRLQAALTMRNALTVGAVVAAALGVLIFVPRDSADAVPMLEADATFDTMTKLHTETNLAYVVPADSPTAAIPAASEKPAKDEYGDLYSVEGM
jgi:hypothetical protein